jgi:hypothetical protein
MNFFILHETSQFMIFRPEVLKKFKMKDCARVNAPIECGVKMSKNDEGEKINSTTFKSLVESLRYLTCTHSYILYEVGLVSRFMETPTMIHFKSLKQILWYIKGTVDFDLFFDYSNSFKLIGYSDND